MGGLKWNIVLSEANFSIALNRTGTCTISVRRRCVSLTLVTKSRLLQVFRDGVSACEARIGIGPPLGSNEITEDLGDRRRRIPAASVANFSETILVLLQLRP